MKINSKTEWALRTLHWQLERCYELRDAERSKWETAYDTYFGMTMMLERFGFKCPTLLELKQYGCEF